MQTRTFTALITITDDGMSAAFSPTILAAALQGALESGIASFMLDSRQAAALNTSGNPLIGAAVAGDHRLMPVASAHVDAFDGDRLECKPGTVGHTAAAGSGAAKRLHAELRKA